MLVASLRSCALHLLRCSLAALCCSPTSLLAQDAPDSTRAKQDVLWAQMARTIDDVVHAANAVVGVAVLDLTDQRAYYLNAEAVYPTASTIKIAVLGELYSQHQRGRGAKLDELYVVNAKDFVGGEGVLQAMTPGVTRLTNRDLATLVVSLSDNAATNVLIDRVGMDAVNAWLARLELKQTRLRRHMMDVNAAREGRENTASPRELVALLRAVHDGRAFDQPTTDAFIGMLSMQKTGYLARQLPVDLKIANKPGNLDGVRNDAGIVYTPNRPFAIAVMVTYARNDLEAEASIARIGHAAWSYFERVGKSSPLGRVVR
jgi:beta-lactamase class A